MLKNVFLYGTLFLFFVGCVFASDVTNFSVESNLSVNNFLFADGVKGTFYFGDNVSYNSLGSGFDSNKYNSGYILGGRNNRFDNPFSLGKWYNVLLAGTNNTISGGVMDIPAYSTILNGYNNYIYGGWNSIVSGDNNKVYYYGNIIGSSNSVVRYAPNSIVLGGSNNVIYNSRDSIVLGGYNNNLSNTDVSGAFGRNIKNVKPYTFYFSDNVSIGDSLSIKNLYVSNGSIVLDNNQFLSFKDKNGLIDGTGIIRGVGGAIRIKSQNAGVFIDLNNPNAYFGITNNGNTNFIVFTNGTIRSLVGANGGKRVACFNNNGDITPC